MPVTDIILQLQGHQLFVNNLINPQSSYKRLLLNHGTGTGKTMIIHSLAKKYIDFFKQMKTQPWVTIIGFTERIIIKELQKFPELGYIKQSEIDELEMWMRENKDNLSNLNIKSYRKNINCRRFINSKIEGNYKKCFNILLNSGLHLFDIKTLIIFLTPTILLKKLLWYYQE